MAQSSVSIQITPESAPTIPSWFAEVAAFAQVLTHVGILTAIRQHVRFARTHFGHYDLIDFVVILIGSILSGEPTLLAFYERLAPWAEPFMALFGRDQLPHRSTLSRFLAALDQNTVEALRTRFQEEVLARKPFPCVFEDFPCCGQKVQTWCLFKRSDYDCRSPQPENGQTQTFTHHETLLLLISGWGLM